MEYSVYAFLETKADGEEGQFSGYASTYGNDLADDRITPGAYGKSIVASRGRVPIFWGHPSPLGGSDQAGYSRRLVEDQKGLYIEGDLATKTQRGHDAYEFLKFARQHDAKPGLSIGFVPKQWDMDGSTRVLKEIDVHEVSIVPFPAQPRARVEEVKTADFENCQTIRDLELILRDVGNSHLWAKTLIATVRRLDSKVPEAQRDVSGLVRTIRNEKLRLLATTYLSS